MRVIARLLPPLAVFAVFSAALLHGAASPSATAKKSAAKAPAPKGPAKKSSSTKSSATAKRRPVSRYATPTYADPTEGDAIDGEDLVVRRAAVEALGGLNGTVVAVDPTTGRVLSIVNQKLALKSGFCPCSTIKLVTSLAALSEGLVDRTTKLRLSRRVAMDLTEALAVSNNPYFAQLGNKLGFEKLAYYARLFGLGEKAGLNIPGEQPGEFPETKPAGYSVGLMTSFGTGIRLTPLQLASLLSAIANGGTLYYLQYPQSQKEVENFTPRVKRHLDIQPYLSEIKPGMLGAVEYGTAKRAAYDPSEPVFGKTGTCSEFSGPPAHLGWFGAFNDTGKSKLVVVVLLTGGRTVNGPLASSVAGAFFKTLSQSQFFAQTHGYSPAAMVGAPTCCAQ